MRYPMRFIVMAAVALLVGGRPAAAAPITISLDTSALVGLTGPYYLEFQLIDGDGLANSLVQLSNFNFFGGAAVGTPTLNGGGSGSIGSSVSLSDPSFFNGLFQAFTAGIRLSFDLNFTAPFTGTTPDQFSFSILNSSLFPIGLGVGGELLSIDFTGSPTIATYAGTSAFGDPALAAPTAASVPEPSALLFLGAALAAAGLRRTRFRRR